LTIASYIKSVKQTYTSYLLRIWRGESTSSSQNWVITLEDPHAHHITTRNSLGELDHFLQPTWPNIHTTHQNRRLRKAMKKLKWIPLAFYIFILVFTSVSCRLGSLLTSKSTGDESTKLEQPQAQTGNSDLLGDEYRSDAGGFTIRQPNGYELIDRLGIIQIAPPDTDLEVGPMIMVVGGLNESESTLNERYEVAKKESGGYAYGRPEKITVGGFDGLTSDVTGSKNGQALKGKMVLVMVTPLQMFAMLGAAPENRWEEVAPVFDAVLNSVTFFEPDPYEGENDESYEMPTIEPPEEIASEAGNVDAATGEIRQWATSAAAGSQYGNSEWSARQATGAPDAKNCESSGKAWAPAKSTGQDWIELTYAIPVYPTEINIYQNFNPSQVSDIEITNTDGERFLIWTGEPTYTDYCPDLMTINVDLDGEQILVESITIWIDQSVLGLGWVEIDAVELVGTAAQSEVAQQPPALRPSAGQTNQNVPTNYSGWMAGPVYQGYLKIIPGQTKMADLDHLMTLEGKKSTENWKPRTTHADTYIYKLQQDNMTAYISVDTSGLVYKKSITPNTYPSDFQLSTVTDKTYKELDAIYKRDKVIPYEVMANMLQHPGYLSEMVLREDGTMTTSYQWFNARGDRITGYFIDGKLTGIAGLAFIPKE
jgi:hypothetical protein